ncbi:uncharacterized protein LOC136088468 [Hydra vulgaris]|uniref:Uncharacterized protein LOC136088468 n=1 Tax=Hydra vulgaris TaxID=6087 RepID=A0ABM4D221_HYDVU
MASHTQKRKENLSVKNNLTESIKKKYSKVLKSTNEIWLVGYPLADINTSSLPTTRDVYRFFRYQLKMMNNWIQVFSKCTIELGTKSNISKLKLAAKLTMKTVKVFWDKADIPCKQEKYIIESIIKLHDKWRSLAKSKHECFSRKDLLIQGFRKIMDNFFDISSPNWKEYVKKTRSNLNAEEDILWFSTLKSGVKTGGLGGKDNLLKLSVKRKIEKEEKEKLKIDKEKKRKLNDKEIDFSVYKSDCDSTKESFFAAFRGSMYSDSQSSSKIDYEVNNFESSTGVMENVVSDNINLILSKKLCLSSNDKNNC